MDACFTAFDKDGDGLLSLAEFTTLCRALFRNDKGHIYAIPDMELGQMFQVFDGNEDNFIDRDEFQFCWHHWIKTIMRPISAVLVVNVQNDFISGSLNITNCNAKQNEDDAIIESINRVLDSIDFDMVFYLMDWHPSDHISFIDNIKLRPLHQSNPISIDSVQDYDTVIFDGDPPMKQCLWPRHCTQDSWGAELHKNLKNVENSVKIFKGTDSDIDLYSLIRDNQKITDTTLNAQLHLRSITDIYVCGFVYDVCLGDSAIDVISNRFRTILVDDCSNGIGSKDVQQQIDRFLSTNGVIIKSQQIRAMIEGRDRRPELGYKLAMQLKNEKSAFYPS